MVRLGHSWSDCALYLFSLNPAGIATSAALTAVVTFSTSLVVVMKVERPLFSFCPSCFWAALLFARPLSRLPTLVLANHPWI